MPDYVSVEAYSHECISAGWWAGGVGTPVTEPAFYAYAYPEPAGCQEARVAPAGASFNADMRIWVLPYDVVRNSFNPDAALLQFLSSTYSAAAELSGWDRASLERDWKG